MRGFGDSAGARALIGRGQVRHQRMRPASNAFSYPVFFLLLPMRAMRRDPGSLGVPLGRRALWSFDPRDHGEGGPDALAWAERLLREQGIDDVDGEIWLQTFPRVLGYVFKPVSFWFGHRRDGTLRVVLAEVNNTFGERHVYLLEPPPGRQDLHWGETILAAKVFHVSPFCRVQGTYHFRFARASRDGGAAERLVARVDHHDGEGPLLLTSISGELRELSAARAWSALLAQPLLTLGVVWRIHWQALRLWRKRVPWFAKPRPPQQPLTRSDPSLHTDSKAS
ncbi:MAG: DUF1365 domain-containing protein [Betaproteobacteria bacterium]|nr:DUF1365 domain-containing protein [Betaproteobacteria bacterium]